MKTSLEQIKIQKIFFLALLFCSLKSWAAVVLTFNPSDGKLTGATGLVVGSNEYKVEFIDDEPTNIYSSVPGGLAFNHTSNAGAQLFAQAVLDQIINGIYETDPVSNISGCSSFEFPASQCSFLLPYGFSGGTTIFSPTVSTGSSGELVSSTVNSWAIFDSTLDLPITFVKFSQTSGIPNVPIPGAVLLYSSGIALMAFWGRRRVIKQ